MDQFLRENINWTEEQKSVLKSNPNKIIKGCAGTGKTLLAIHLAIKLKNDGLKVGIILFTKALRSYIQHTLIGLNASEEIEVFYEWEWFSKKCEFDVIILDEFQDFSLNNVQKIISYSKNGVYLFGDLEQRLYETNLNKEQTISKDELNDLKNFDTCTLTKNFRVPNGIVRVANNIALRFNNRKSLNLNSDLSDIKPEFLQFESHQSELNWLVSFLKTNQKYKNVGILFNKNKDNKIDKSLIREMEVHQNLEEIPSILNLSNYLLEQGIDNVGYKYENQDNLNFQNSYNINLLTIHSSKGLEFDCVILPFSKLDNCYFNENQMYVALTRAKGKLIISYSGFISHVYTKLVQGLIDGKIHGSKIIDALIP